MRGLDYFELDRQTFLRSNLEEKLDDVRILTNRYISHPNELISSILPYVSKTHNLNEIVLLGQALRLSHNYHSTGEFSVRDSGDTYLVHPIQTGVILKELGMDLATRAAAILHDVIENNQDMKEQIIEEMYSQNLGASLPYVIAMTPPSNITNSKLKKEAIQKQVTEFRTEFGKFDTQKKIYGLRSADRLTNLLTLGYMQPKDGRSPEERIMGVVYDTRKNILQLAQEFDIAFGAELKLHDYMFDTLGRYKPSTEYLSMLKHAASLGLGYLHSETPVLNTI